ncbi:MAG: hypothetical protein ACYCU7_17230 [Acidimicrobiales bacterium]
MGVVRGAMVGGAALLGVTGLVSWAGSTAAGAAGTSDTSSVTSAPGGVTYVKTGASIGAPQSDPADITSASATDDGTTLTFTAQTVSSGQAGYTPVGPGADPNWLNDTYIGWQLNTTGNLSGPPDYVVYWQLDHAGNYNGELVLEQTNRPVGSPGVVSCGVNLSFGSGTFTATLPASCLAGATSFAWDVFSNYDTVAGDNGSQAFGKVVPYENTSQKQYTYAPTVTAPSVAIAASSTPAYWLFGRDGGVFAFGGAPFENSLPGEGVSVNDIVDGVSTIDHKGYWMVGADGGVFSFGDALFYGSEGGVHLDAPIVAIAAVPNGAGYWEVASDGGVFSFGSAQFYGSMGGQHLNAPIVGMASTPDGGGYWLFARDGGVFAFGDAAFYQSMGGQHLNAPMVGGVATSDGHGYWLVGADGGVFAFGDATFYGSMGGIRLVGPMLGIVPSADGNGYWTVAADGGVFAFGDAPFFGSLGGTPRTDPIVALAMALT